MDYNYNDKIQTKNVIRDIVDTDEEFPTYSKHFINNANEFGGGTRPEVVGQMSDLVPECPHNSYHG